MNSLPQITATLLTGTYPVRLKSLQSLVELSSRNHDGDRERILVQVQDLLLNLLRSQEAPIVEKTVECIRYLARNNANKVALEKAGVIEPLKDLLQSRSEKTKASAAGALWSLAVNPDNKIKIGASGAIPSLIQILRTGSPEARTTAAGAIWNLSVNNQLEVEIVRLGAIEPLVELLQTGTNDGKNRAAQALSNLCYNAQHKVLAAKAGAIPSLIEVLKTGSQDARTNACSALWNIAVNLQNKTTIAQCGGIEALVTVLQEGTIDSQINAAAALATLTINHDENQNKIDSLFVLEEIVRVLTRKPEFNADMCTALNNFTKNSRNVDVVINFGLENILKALQKEKNKTNHERLCGCLRNLTLTESGKKILVQNGVIEAFVDTLNGDMESSKDEAAAGLYNLALDPQIVPQILEKGAKPALENTQASSSNKQAQIRASAVLRMLRQVEASPVQNHPNSTPITKEGGVGEKLVTISYSPRDQKKVFKIARILSDLGLTVSLESTDSQPVPDQNSNVLLICLSHSYSNAHGRAIAQEFHQSKKQLFGLILDSYQPSGWVVALLGSHLFDLSFGNDFFLGLNEVVRFVRHQEAHVGFLQAPLKHASRDDWMNWTGIEIGEWLKTFDLNIYTERFIEEGIDGVALDQMIDLWKTKDDVTLEGLLNEMGVTGLGERIKFWSAIQELVSGNYCVRSSSASAPTDRLF